MSLGGDSAWAGSCLMVSDDTGNGDWFPMTTAALTGRWLQVLWLADICDARGGACVSSNEHASVHRRAQTERRGGVYQDCVQSAGISGSPAGDRVTASLDSCVLLYCGVFLDCTV